MSSEALGFNGKSLATERRWRGLKAQTVAEEVLSLHSSLSTDRNGVQMSVLLLPLKKAFVHSSEDTDFSKVLSVVVICLESAPNSSSGRRFKSAQG